MNIKKISVSLVLAALSCLPFTGFSQSWSYNYSAAPFGYTSIGGVTANTGNVQFTNATGAAFRRACYPIDASLSSLTDRFRMDFDFSFSPNSPGAAMAHWLAAATSNDLDPTCSVLPSTPTTIDVIGVQLTTPTATSSANPYVCIGVKQGAGSTALSSGVNVNPGTSYYATLERHGPGTLKLSIFTNASRTTHAAGSPICFTAFNSTTGTGAQALKYLQHGVVSWAGASRTMTGTVDNLELDIIPSPSVLTATTSQTLCAPGDVASVLTASFGAAQFIGTYQWQVYNFGFWASILGQTNPTLNPGATGVTTKYRCVYTITGCGAATYYSNVVEITVNVFHPLIDCNISDDYSVGAPVWTQTGTEVEVNPALANCFFKYTSEGPTSQRVSRSIGYLPNNKWRADFDFNFDGFQSPDAHHYIAAFTNVNTAPMSASQDIIYAQVKTIAGQVQIFGGSRNSSGTIYSSPTGINITSATYYISIERLCSTKGRISVFTNSGRTTHASGSPQYFTIDAGVTGLNYLQHANDINYTTMGSRLTAIVDNLCIDNDYQFGGHRMATAGVEDAIGENALQSKFRVYPNPSDGIVTISTDGFMNGSVDIYDISGKKVKSVELRESMIDYRLDLSGYSKGVYLLNFISEGKIQSKKIILE